MNSASSNNKSRSNGASRLDPNRRRFSGRAKNPQHAARPGLQAVKQPAGPQEFRGQQRQTRENYEPAGDRRKNQHHADAQKGESEDRLDYPFHIAHGCLSLLPRPPRQELENGSSPQSRTDRYDRMRLKCAVLLESKNVRKKDERATRYGFAEPMVTLEAARLPE